MELDERIAFCGVVCSDCPDRIGGKCPGCRKTDWGDDPCPPVGCCTEKRIDCCADCATFPCEMMAEFYQETDVHREAYRRMCIVREKKYREKDGKEV